MKKFFSMLLCGVMLMSFTSCEESISNRKKFVDLGLPSGTLWATCNVGANSPEDNGDYFAWGETEPKARYFWDTYKFGTYSHGPSTKNDYSKLTKYNPTDGKKILDASDDAATVNWGSEWRMPTTAEQNELRTECTWEWDAQKKGYQVIGKNGNSIFLPAAGSRDSGNSISDEGLVGNYWSSSLNPDYPSSALHLFFTSSYRDSGGQGRDFGHSVRPVRSY